MLFDVASACSEWDGEEGTDHDEITSHCCDSCSARGVSLPGRDSRHILTTVQSESESVYGLQH